LELGRRELVGLVGSAVAWPVVVRAQQPMPAIGTAHDHEARFWRPRRRAWYDSSDIEADI
jgi:hypothetical protein